MKKIKYILVLFLVLLIKPLVVQAAPSYTLSTNSYTTVGSSVTATLRISNAASWNIRLNGGGATSGCSTSSADATSNAKNSTQTFTVTCRATNVGQISFTATGDATDQDGNSVNISVTKTVSVQAPREKDSNNYLKSLSVKDYKLTPDFNKETLEYSLTVPNTVNKITLEGATESNYATVEGFGEVEVNEGANKFEIKVVSETGSERVYTITVNVKDENPIEVEIKDGDYTIMKNAKTLEAPSTYIQTTVTINNVEIPAFYSEISKFTLIGVKDSKGDTHFAIYHKEDNTYELYNENQSTQMLLFIKSIPEELEGFRKDTITINESSRECLISNSDESIVLIYAMNINTGESAYYLYDKEEDSYVKYHDGFTKEYEEKLEKYKQVILAFAGVAIGFLLIIVILLFTKKKKTKIIIKPDTRNEEIQEEPKTSKKEKKNKKKKSKEKNIDEKKEEELKIEKIETPKKGKKKSKEDALEQVSNAAKMIEDYEKTRELTKNELQSIQEKSSDEDTMFDILENSKKKKKK